MTRQPGLSYGEGWSRLLRQISLRDKWICLGLWIVIVSSSLSLRQWSWTGAVCRVQRQEAPGVFLGSENSSAVKAPGAEISGYPLLQYPRKSRWRGVFGHSPLTPPPVSKRRARRNTPRPGCVIERLMKAPCIVEGEIVRSDRALEARRVRPQIDLLVLHAAPQPLDEHVIDPSPLAIHADRNAGGLQRCEPPLAGVLRALVGIKNLRSCRISHRLLECFDAECAVRVFDRRQASTLRLTRSRIAIRYIKPCAIGR